MAEVGTGADPLVMPLDCLEDVDHLVVAVLGAVVVDRDPDVELLDKVVEAGDRVGVGGEGGEADELVGGGVGGGDVRDGGGDDWRVVFGEDGDGEETFVDVAAGVGDADADWVLAEVGGKGGA
jgi:hypothetical protein